MSESGLTIARLTGPGPGAVAVYRLAGPKAAAVLSAKLRLSGGKTLIAQQLTEAGRSAQKQPIFARLALTWTDPADPAGENSTTSGENMPSEEIVLYPVDAETFEIDTHGGDSIAAAFFRTFEQAGGIRLNLLAPSPKESFIQTAERLLPFVRTDWTAGILLDQINDAAGRFIRTLSADVEKGTLSRNQAADKLETIAGREYLGRHLTEPFHVVLTGPVNVGKSTLFNALLGFDRAIADQTPGTTRDALFADTALEGVPIRFYDTAGLRRTADPIEQSGIETAAHWLRRADLVLVLTASDTAEADSPIDLNFAEKPQIQVRTKSDLLPESVLLSDGKNDVIFVSSFDRESIAGLERRIIKSLIPQMPPEGGPVPLTEFQTAFYRNLASRFRSGNPLSEVEKASIMKTISGGID